VKFSFSVILPVLNEATVINGTIDSISAASSVDNCEIIVVDGSPDGETVRALERKEVKTLTAGKGRARQMNAGAAAANGEILIFLHADTTLPRNAFHAISAALEKGNFVGGAFDLSIGSDRTAFRIIERAASFRSRITRVPYGDQAIFVRKKYFDAIGGFREIPLMEDVDLMRRIRKRGGRIRILPDRVQTSPRRWEKEGVFLCTLRNWMIRTLYHLGVSPERLVRFYEET
jgi:rSAM/selenodomain-associated transferase 2